MEVSLNYVFDQIPWKKKEKEKFSRGKAQTPQISKKSIRREKSKVKLIFSSSLFMLAIVFTLKL